MKKNETFKTVVSEKHHFVNRDKSFLITTFWKLWTVKILQQRITSKISEKNLLYQQKFSNRDLAGQE